MKRKIFATGLIVVIIMALAQIGFRLTSDASASEFGEQRNVVFSTYGDNTMNPGSTANVKVYLIVVDGHRILVNNRGGLLELTK